MKKVMALLLALAFVLAVAPVALGEGNADPYAAVHGATTERVSCSFPNKLLEPYFEVVLTKVTIDGVEHIDAVEFVQKETVPADVMSEVIANARPGTEVLSGEVFVSHPKDATRFAHVNGNMEYSSFENYFGNPASYENTSGGSCGSADELFQIVDDGDFYRVIPDARSRGNIYTGYEISTDVDGKITTKSQIERIRISSSQLPGVETTYVAKTSTPRPVPESRVMPDVRIADASFGATSNTYDEANGLLEYVITDRAALATNTDIATKNGNFWTRIYAPEGYDCTKMEFSRMFGTRTGGNIQTLNDGGRKYVIAELPFCYDGGKSITVFSLDCRITWRNSEGKELVETLSLTSTGGMTWMEGGDWEAAPAGNVDVYIDGNKLTPKINGNSYAFDVSGMTITVTDGSIRYSFENMTPDKLPKLIKDIRATAIVVHPSTDANIIAFKRNGSGGSGSSLEYNKFYIEDQTKIINSYEFYNGSFFHDGIEPLVAFKIDGINIWYARRTGVPDVLIMNFYSSTAENAVPEYKAHLTIESSSFSCETKKPAVPSADAIATEVEAPVMVVPESGGNWELTTTYFPQETAQDTNAQYFRLEAKDEGGNKLNAETEIYLPFPEGLDYEKALGMEFTLKHYTDTTHTSFTTHVVTVTTKGLMFKTSTLSPFTLLWSEKQPDPAPNPVYRENEPQPEPAATAAPAEDLWAIFRAMVTNETSFAPDGLRYTGTEYKFLLPGATNVVVTADGAVVEPDAAGYYIVVRGAAVRISNAVVAQAEAVPPQTGDTHTAAGYAMLMVMLACAVAVVVWRGKCRG